jgi:hypothetical protein
VQIGTLPISFRNSPYPPPKFTPVPDEKKREPSPCPNEKIFLKEKKQKEKKRKSNTKRKEKKKKEKKIVTPAFAFSGGSFM